MVTGLITFLCLTLVLSACGGDTLPAPHIVAQIEDQQVRYSEFEMYLQENSVDSGLALASDVLSELFDQFLDEELLRRVAMEKDLIEPTGTRRTAVRAVVGELEAGTIPAERVTAYYRDHGQEFELEERVRLRQVLVEDRATAEEVHRRMLTGTPFEEVLGDSDLNSSALWGDEGELSSGDLPPGLADTIFGLEPGEVSEVVAADYGFHIFQVVERLPPEQMELARAEEQILEILRRDLVDDGLEKLVAEARERYNVQVFRRNIPFNYAGAY
ncbi:MAG: peptidylprolyl isomerase [Thermoanaerobaculia bacterium]